MKYIVQVFTWSFFFAQHNHCNIVCRIHNFFVYTVLLSILTCMVVCPPYESGIYYCMRNWNWPCKNWSETLCTVLESTTLIQTSTPNKHRILQSYCYLYNFSIGILQSMAWLMTCTNTQPILCTVLFQTQTIIIFGEGEFNLFITISTTIYKLYMVFVIKQLKKKFTFLVSDWTICNIVSHIKHLLWCLWLWYFFI